MSGGAAGTGGRVGDGAVVVTGLGAVHPFGFGAAALAAALAAGEARTVAVPRHPGLRRRRAGPPAETAALVPERSFAEWIAPLEGRRMSPPSRFAVAAAKMAWAEAGLEPPAPGAATDPAVSVVLATAYGACSFSERLLEQLYAEGPDAMSPALFTESVANAPAAQVAMQCRATGPNHTICQREAGPLLALAHGAAEVYRGAARRALVGAVEEITPLIHAVLDGFGALATATPAASDSNDADAAEAARPFDRRRNGFVAASGAAVAMLEGEAAARARGAPILARVRGWGSAFDPSASPAGWGRGEERLAAALVRTLERAGLTAADVDLVVSGASGSVGGDRLEARTLRAAWAGRPLPPVAAPKAVTGEYAGGHLAAAVLAAAGRPLGPTPGFAAPDPACGVTPHDGSPLPPPRCVLATALAAGGAAAWVILERP